jgi:hypothetical protein
VLIGCDEMEDRRPQPLTAKGILKMFMEIHSVIWDCHGKEKSWGINHVVSEAVVSRAKWTMPNEVEVAHGNKLDTTEHVALEPPSYPRRLWWMKRMSTMDCGTD